jgi:hypothetical protein
MLSNEVFALQCRAKYEAQGLVVDATNGEFAHSPLTRKECETGYYLLHEHHQHQGLLQSRDLDKCCFFPGHAKKWLVECDYFPEDYFGLWDIYEQYVKKVFEKLHDEKDESGRSVHAVKAAERAHKEKDEFGRSVLAVRNSAKIHAEKNEEGKSLHTLRVSKKVHAAKNEEGKSLHALKLNKRLHEARDEEGKSLHALLMNEKLHKEKDELGRSKTAMKTNTQIWESTVDGFRSTAGPVALHNKARGWDPNARVRIS